MKKNTLCILSCLIFVIAGCQKQTVRSKPAKMSPGIVLHSPQPAAQGDKVIISDASERTNLYDIVYDDTPLLDVIKDFAKKVGAPIIADPSDLNGSVTVNLEEVEWKPALVSILDMWDLFLVEKTPGSGVYSIMKKIAGQPPPLITTVLLFTNREETVDFANAVREIWESNGVARAAAVPSRNAVILKGTEASISEIMHIRGIVSPEESK